MMKDHASGHGSVSGSPDHTRAASCKEEKEKENEGTRVLQNSLAKNKHKILKCGQKRTLLGGTNDARAIKDCQKAMLNFQRLVFALTSQI